MEYGFNCKTHKLEKMYNYEVITYMFDFDEQYLNKKVSEGLQMLEIIFKFLIGQIDERNFHIIIKLTNEEELDLEDYITLFSTFSILFADQKGVPNKKGYLNSTDTLHRGMAGTNYAHVALLNNNFESGIIQLTIEDEKGYQVKWINQVK